MSAGIVWDEPTQAASARGWLMRDGVCVGFYLDYGPEHYRSPHGYDRSAQGHLCRDCQPGSILACRYPNGPGEEPRESRYVETVGEARGYVETGRVVALV